MLSAVPLTEEQEERRREGLRILARIIAQHFLEHPELYATDGKASEQQPHDKGRGAMTGRLDQTSDREGAE